MSEQQNGSGSHRGGVPTPYLPAFPPAYSEADPGPEPQAIRLRDYREAIRRHFWLVLAAVLAGAALAWIILARQSPEYRSTAVLELKDEAAGGAGRLGGLIGLSSALGGGSSMLTQVEILKSRRMAGMIVDSVGFRLQKSADSRDFPSGLLTDIKVTRGPDAPWETIELAFSDEGVKATSSEGGSVSAPYGSPIHFPDVRFTVSARPPMDEAELVVLTRDQAVGAFQNEFFVVQRDRTSILDLGFTADDPAVSQRVANAAATIFQEQSIQRSDAANAHRREFLREQMAYTDSMLMEAQSRLSAFQSEQHAYSATAKFQERQSQIAERETQRAEAEADLRMYRTLLAGLRQASGENVGAGIRTIVSSPAVAGNPVVGPLFSKLVEYQTTRDTMTAGEYGRAPTNPDVQRMDRLIRETQAQLVSAVSSHVASQEAQLGSLRELQGEAVASIEGLPAADAEEVRLTQEVAGLGEMSLFLREEYHKLRLSEVVESGKLEIVDLALPGWSVNTPSWQIVLSCIVLGLIMGGGGAVLLDRANTSIRRRDDVERVLQLSPLAVIPSIASGPFRRSPLPLPTSGRNPNGNGHRLGKTDLVATSHANSTSAEAYRTLRTNLIFSQALQTLKTIVVTSPSLGEGRTTVAANLAVTFAQQGMRVLLVDCDLRRPRLHEIFGVQREPGLTHLVLGQGGVADVVRPTSVEGLSVLPAGLIPPMNPSDLLGGSRMNAALDQLSAGFDLLILDTPPLLASTAGTAALSAKADGVLLVLRAGRTDRDDAQHALQQLAAVGARVVGAVLNDPDAKTSREAPYEEAKV